MPGFVHKMMLHVVRRSGGEKIALDALKQGYVVREELSKRTQSKYRIRETQYNKRRIFQYGEAKNGEPLLYLLHGGGFIMGMTRAHFEPFGEISKKTGFTAIAPDFPLPPETDNKGVIEFVLAHFREVQQAFPDSPIIVAGDSAGAHMSLNLVQRLSLEERANIRALYLLFGVFDLTRPANELEFPDEEVLLTYDLASALPSHWAGDLNLDDPIVSPILGNLNDLPRISLYSANRDPVYMESVRMSEKLSSMGVDHGHKIFDGYGHVFFLIPSPDGKKALSGIARDLKKSMD